MTKPLSEQVAELERQITEVWDTAEAWKLNSERHWKRVEELEAERDRLKADAVSDLIKRHWLENQVRNREAERDDLQRQVQEARVQEARDYIAALRAGQGRRPRLGPATAPTVPRPITADELQERQIIAVWDQSANGDITGEVLKIHRLGTNEDGDIAAWQKLGGYWPIDDSTHIVLLADAPQPTGYADDDHQDAEVTQWHQPTPRLTVHDLEVAPAGSVLERAYFMPWQKRDDGKWVPDWQLGRNARTSEELIAKGFADATLTTPEAQ